MSTRHILAAAIIGGFAVGCTYIVSNKFSDTDTYKQNGDPTSPGGDSCALTEVDAGNSCSQCITTNCASDVKYACADGKNKKNWFTLIEGCAQFPYRGSSSSWKCARYNDFDAQAIQGTDDPAKERASELCIRDKCNSGATPACNLCEITTTTPGTSSKEVPLEADQCGKCLREKCAPTLVKCCTSSIVQGTVSACGYTNDPAKKSECQSLATVDAGKVDASTEASCTAEISQCYRDNCKGNECP